MQSHIAKNIRGSVSSCSTAVGFLKSIEQQYVYSDKAKVSTLMSQLCSMKYIGNGGIREHIMEMRDIATRLNVMEVTFSDTFLVHFILLSLPSEYNLFKVSYNTSSEKWSVNQLLTKCVEEEERLKREKIETAHLASEQGSGSAAKGKGAHKVKGKKNALAVSKDTAATKGKIKCFFCKRQGHHKKDCIKHKKWLEKKGINFALVCHEVNFVNVPKSTFWIDSGATVHIVATSQGFLSRRAPTDGEKYIVSGNKMRSPVKAVGCYS
jgi:hypothetical protein